MLKKDITFDDIHDNTVTESFYFNISKLEALELDLKYGGLENMLKELSNTTDAQKAYGIFKDILLASYGRISANGRDFEKVDENGTPLRHQFESSNALGELIIEMLQNPAYAAEFMEGLLPAKLVAQAKAAEASKDGDTPAPVVETAPPVLEQKSDPTKKFEDYSRAELLDMSDEAFFALVGNNAVKWTAAQTQIAMQRKLQNQ